MSEVFKLIENFPNYQVSNFGYVRNMVTSEILIPVIDKKGDALVTIFVLNCNYTAYVKKFVANAFIPNLDPNKKFINNLDKNKSNNHFLNLIWIDCLPKEVQKNNTSGCNNVFKKGNKWIVSIMVDYQIHHFGTFSNKEDAIIARKNAEIKYNI